jgi:hypothetical protein
MKGWLIIGAIAFSSVAHAASSTANAHPQQSIAVESKPVPVSTRTMPAPPSQSQAQPVAGVRHLSDEERAELRRQLQQFIERYGKRS